MLSVLISTAALLASSVSAAPTLWLIGDSTMALHAASEGIQGWGVEVPTYFTGLTVSNQGISGTSARSYARDGMFYNLIHNSIKAGDFVVIEFGHNDGGGAAASSTGDAGTTGLTTTQTVTLANGTSEVVHTYNYYVEGMVDQIIAKGATAIVSSQTPNNPYENTTTIVNDPPRFVGYAATAASDKGVAYVNHFQSVIDLFTPLGTTTVNSYYPNDQHVHTNTAGAIVVAKAFIGGLKCSSAKSVLNNYLSSSGQALASAC
ncbi:SGNH hydrolase [Clavulina sp. PMI_390]|nr:SGNH hydrolase [Clavulina sp. PMI_390]